MLKRLYFSELWFNIDIAFYVVKRMYSVWNQILQRQSASLIKPRRIKLFGEHNCLTG